ncbi:hypothetical protein D3C73_1256220 [compost metagenome]
MSSLLALIRLSCSCRAISREPKRRCMVARSGSSSSPSDSSSLSTAVWSSSTPSARGSQRSSACRSVANDNGLASTSSMPASRQRRASSSSTLAVSASTGIRGWRLRPSRSRSRRVKPNPSSTGMRQSVMTRSKDSDSSASRSRACCPSSTSTCGTPSCCRRQAIMAWLVGWSSMTITRAWRRPGGSSAIC